MKEMLASADEAADLEYVRNRKNKRYLLKHKGPILIPLYAKCGSYPRPSADGETEEKAGEDGAAKDLNGGRGGT